MHVAARVAAHPLAPIVNAAFDHDLTYGELSQMLAPRPARALEAAPDPGAAAEFERFIESAADAAEGRAAMLELALLYLDRLGDAYSAELLLVRILATDPGHSAADAYQRLLRRDCRHAEAALVLERAIQASGGRADRMIELASIAYESLGQTDRAITLLRGAYALDPERMDVLVRARVMLIERERWTEVKPVLDEEAERVLGGAGAAEATIHALAESYRLLGDRLFETGQPELARDCFSRAAYLGDEEAARKENLSGHYAARWSRMATLCRDHGFEVRDRRLAAVLHLRSAGFWFDYGADMAAAEAAFDRAWILDPENGSALALLERAYLSRRRPRQLLAKLYALAGSARNRAVVIDLLVRAARLVERERLGDPIRAYRRVLDLEPGHEEALARTDRLLSARRKSRERAELLESAIPHLGAHRATDVAVTLGRLYAFELGDYAKARAHLEEVSAADRPSPAAFEACEILRAICRDQGDGEGLRRVVDRLLECCPERSARIELEAERSNVMREFR
jgi:tetratricopeptide (TPR) repeat protein